jgi:uncharacterized protein (TIGR02678 family)
LRLVATQDPPWVVEERKQAMRALLTKPLLTAATDPLEFGRIRKHFDWLRSWFSKEVGWRLERKAETVRLYKRPASGDDSTHGPSDFNRRHFTLFCLALAALERSERQTTLGKLADQIHDLWASDEALIETGFQIDFERQSHRRGLVKVLRLLVEFGIIALVHGDEQQFVAQEGDALYNLNRAALTYVIPPLRLNDDNRLESMLAEAVASSDRRIQRYRLTRQLLDDPVLYYDELDPEEQLYLQSQRTRICKEIEQATGLVTELRSEGLAMVDPGLNITDRKMPQEGTQGHHTLLLATYLAGHLKRRGSVAVPRAKVEQETVRLIKKYKRHWSNQATRAGHERALTDEALECMRALRLLRVTEVGVVPLAPIARYAVGEKKT